MLALAAIALFVALGRWQLRRGHEKAELFAAFDHAEQQPAVSLEQARREASPAHYPRVRIHGRYDPLHAYVLDDQVRGGRTGVIVFDVFEPAAGGRPLLANQGFLAFGARGERPPIPPPPDGARTLDALYAPPPGAGLRLGGDVWARQPAWPKFGISIDLDELGRDLGRRLDPHVLLLLPEPGSAFAREWRPEVFPPERHYAYAFTWFTSAAATAALFAFLHRPGGRST